MTCSKIFLATRACQTSPIHHAPRRRSRWGLAGGKRGTTSARSLSSCPYPTPDLRPRLFLQLDQLDPSRFSSRCGKSERPAACAGECWLLAGAGCEGDGDGKWKEDGRRDKMRLSLIRLSLIRPSPRACTQGGSGRVRFSWTWRLAVNWAWRDLDGSLTTLSLAHASTGCRCHDAVCTRPRVSFAASLGRRPSHIPGSEGGSTGNQYTLVRTLSSTCFPSKTPACNTDIQLHAEAQCFCIHFTPLHHLLHSPFSCSFGCWSRAGRRLSCSAR